MLCGACRTSKAQSPHPDPAHTQDRALETLRALSCRRCGRFLPAPDSTDILLATIALLSRFGLGGEGLPILPGV